ncbi:hypothetical protein M9H77_27959 [Catharanthus roseus]|uniref:Uncharacterized protein n=1 Tax=Catharanthus roseus TaxID=4058 RepID=A0ACC0AF11_CATRO|nr:hypothetical protein M9H77_27959 [Catharanthus roseus]
MAQTPVNKNKGNKPKGLKHLPSAAGRFRRQKKHSTETEMALSSGESHERIEPPAACGNGTIGLNSAVRGHERVEAPATSGNSTIGLNSGPSVHGASTKKKNHRCLPLSTFRSLSNLTRKRRSDKDCHKPSFAVNRTALQKTKGQRRATDAASRGKERGEEETETAFEEA